MQTVFVRDWATPFGISSRSKRRAVYLQLVGTLLLQAVPAVLLFSGGKNTGSMAFIKTSLVKRLNCLATRRMLITKISG